MGLFDDLFGKKPQETTERNFAREQRSAQSSTQEKAEGPVSVFMPKNFEDVGKIIDALKNGKNAIVHLNHLKIETASRVSDMLAGAIYAIGGGIYEMQKNVFMYSPTGVEVK